MDENQKKASDIGPDLKDSLSAVAQKEVEILSFWDENEIFKKTLEKNSPKGEFVFYDGPPFANGEPHYGHVLPGTIKDVIPRYKTMQGYKVDRQWGWDCHGLPVENFVQKEFNLQTTKDIRDFGIENFSIKAKESVFRFEKEWKEIMPRTGRWVDMENAYTTMHPLYTQSVWWAFKKIYEKGLVFEDFKVMHVSPELETTLSNFEVNQGYRNVKDISCTVKLELIDQPKTFILAWTTTPWTLPGNVALAVSSDIDYVKIKSNEEFYILAKTLLDKVVKDEYEVIEEFKGDKLIGKSYKPLFDYYVDSKIENVENAWKVYDADFVTTEDGTGVVHIAPAFGNDDYSLLKKYKLPFVQHVKINGTFVDQITDFAGKKVKPKEDPSRIDVEIIKFLAEKNLIYSKEKIEHSYPFCWRTDAPLLNYATSSWFINVPKIKDKLIANNNKIKWVPENVGTLRFGNWLKDAREWAISRSRFWGTPIPIWKSEDGKDLVVIGSLDELKSKTKSTNKFIIGRHAEAEHNVGGFMSENNEELPSHLTEKGKEEALKMAKELKSKKIDVVYVSPLFRTLETVDIIKKELGINDSQIIIDNRITETQTGMNKMSHKEFWNHFKSYEEIYERNAKGESLKDLRRRVGQFIEDIDSRHKDKNILIISHGWPLWMMRAFMEGWSKEEAIEFKNSIGKWGNSREVVHTGNFVELNYSKLPHDKNFEIDLHRPYIDQITFEQSGKKFKRIPEVFDGWVDSGAMPFASKYYPMRKGKFNPGNLFMKSKNFPANFIAEGLDQTRGWFYTLLVLNTALFGKSPFERVVVNGLVLAEDGKKMAKRLKNYPELKTVLNKFGADSMRYYLISSPVVKADDLKFSEKGVDEIMKKIVLRLDNVVSFYELYKSEIAEKINININSKNVLDKWILARLQETRDEITKGLENYELDKASRPIADFVDDLSVWYLRRSRDRIKNGGEDAQTALLTLRFVLAEFSKVLAPFMPFKAEDVYQRTMIDKSEEFKKSVHMEDWPEFSFLNTDVLRDMNVTRATVTKALEKRASAGIKVRQPLSKLEIKDATLSHEYIEIIKDEVNVKEVLSNESMNDEVFLHVKITPELKEEGDAREIIRAVQDQRKSKGLSPDDVITINVDYPSELDKTFTKYSQMIKDTTRAKEIVRKELNEVEDTKINEFSIKLEIEI